MDDCKCGDEAVYQVTVTVRKFLEPEGKSKLKKTEEYKSGMFYLCESCFSEFLEFGDLIY